MFIDFLYAQGPITKEYRADAFGVQEIPYPMIKEFHSDRRPVPDIDTFFAEVQRAADQQGVLLKGLLDRPLNNESRAGHTNPHSPTQWICLDFDFSEGFESVDHALNALDPALSNVSYVFQHSASAGITRPEGLRGHVFILLDKPVLPSIIKEWTKSRNLTVPGLKDQLSLTANGLSLKYPLDVTTNQNDKLLYIAPPIVHGLEDPLAGRRIRLVTKTHAVASLKFHVDAAATGARVIEHVNALRKAAGLRKRTARTKFVNDYEILTNPERALVTGVQEARGFVYLNLNHGDSWAYYFPKDNPEILRNFKDEPFVRLKDIAPDVYAQYTRSASAQDPSSDTTLPLVFRDRETDTYFTAAYDTEVNTIVLWPVSNVQKCQHYMAQRGAEAPEIIEDWDVRFDPTDPRVIDVDERWINVFKPTRYLTENYDPVDDIPPTIDRVLNSLLSEPDAKQHFLNWLAFIFQYREKTQTAWVFFGTTGTGKGLLFDRILRPLFGDEYVVPVLTPNIEEHYNGYLEKALINWLDEFKLSESAHSDKIMDKLKNMITETRTSIRKMRANAVTRKLYNNVIIATNHNDPIPIESNDRRFNVAPPQRRALLISVDEIERIDSELDDFAAFLANYRVDRQAVTRPLENQHRKDVIRHAQNSSHAFFHALKIGDLDYFLQFIDGDSKTRQGLPDLAYKEYFSIVSDWAKSPEPIDRIPRDDLNKLYNYLQGKNFSPAKFTRMLTIHDLEVKPARFNGQLMRGLVLEKPLISTQKTYEPSSHANIVRLGDSRPRPGVAADHSLARCADDDAQESGT